MSKVPTINYSRTASPHHHHTSGMAPRKAGLKQVAELVSVDLPRYARDLGQFVREELSPRRSSPPLRVQVSAETLEEDVHTLVNNFGARDTAHPDNLKKVATHLEGRLRSLPGARVSAQTYAFSLAQLKASGAVELSPDQETMLQRVDGKTYKNVIASFGPEEGERIVIGAHYDTAHGFPGADDNASGVAGALEMAKHLSRRTPGKRVDVVFFANEERPLGLTPFMGSAIYASSLAKQGVRQVKMISLEMLGTFRDEPGSQQMPNIPVAGKLLRAHYGDTGNFIAVVTRAGEAALARRISRGINQVSAVEAKYLVGPGLLRDIMRSDHSSFWTAEPNSRGFDWQAVMVSDTANMRNPHYHQMSDEPQTLDYRRMAEVVSGLMNAVYRLTESEPSSGTRQGRV